MPEFKMIDKFTKYQRFLLGLAIFLSLSAVSITVSDGQINLNLKSYPVLMIFLVLISIALILIYIWINDYQLKVLVDEIQTKATEEKDDFTPLLDNLTARQKTVYQLILEGKSNKEIMAELFIEKSTLKSHINQIYKKLNIKNRKELKSRLTP